MAEGAEHEAAFGQAERLARRREGDRTAPVHRQVAAGQAHQLLAVEALAARWHEGGVADDVIETIQPQCAGVADQVDGHRRRPVPEDAKARALGVAHQVDGDVDLLLAQVPGDFGIAQRVDLVVALEAGAQAIAHAGALGLAVGVSVDVEAAAVVQLEHFGQGRHHGMLGEVGRQVGDADARACRCRR